MTNKPAAAYAELTERFATIGKLAGIRQLLFWDSQTYMPKGGAWNRGEQAATLANLSFDIISAPGMADLLGAAEEEIDGFDAGQRANIREMRRYWRERTVESRDLAERRARATQKAQQSWAAAKQENDFTLFATDLEEVVACHRESAAAYAVAFDVAPLEALMGLYDPGLPLKTVEDVFATVRAELPGLLAEARGIQARWPRYEPFDADFSIPNQQRLAAHVAAAAGFDGDRARTDVGLHPFTMSLSPGDVRFTNRYDPARFDFSIIACLHEMGHALYELHLPRAWVYQRAGQARGATVHESQALLLDRHVARNADFLGWLAPLLREHFGGEASQWTPARIVAHFRRLNGGPLRLQADEGHYLLHILLRHRVEGALMTGDLAVADLPGAWNEIATALFGAPPPDDARGCLQDFHWAAGYMGYFASYALGAALAAQFYAAASRRDAGIPSAIGRGDLAPLLAWAGANVHEKGSLVAFDELVMSATGASLSARPLIEHLRARFVDECLPAN